MEQNFIINPAEVANGTVTRKEITSQVHESATNSGLTALDELRYVRELSKGASDVEKIKDEETKMTLPKRALAQAEALPQLQEALAQDKKEFLYNGCWYQYKTEIKHDLSKETGKYAKAWQKKKAQFDDMATQIADLKAQQETIKAQMDQDGVKHEAATKGKENEYHPTETHTIAVM